MKIKLNRRATVQGSVAMGLCLVVGVVTLFCLGSCAYSKAKRAGKRIEENHRRRMETNDLDKLVSEALHDYGNTNAQVIALSFSMQLTSAVQPVVTIQATSDLVNWEDVATVTDEDSGAAMAKDITAKMQSGVGQQFYRIVAQ